MKLIYLVSILFLASSCASIPKLKIENFSSEECSNIYFQQNWRHEAQALSGVSSLFENACYKEVVSVGSYIRKNKRDKYYSFFSETAELFMTEGTVTEYTLESHERAFLSYLISASYFNQGRHAEAEVELRRAYEESRADIYNAGEDYVNLFLQAALWENLGKPHDAEPLWRRGFELLSKQYPDLKTIEQTRDNYINRGSAAKNEGKWHINSMGEFQGFDWKYNMSSGSNYFDVKAKVDFPNLCIDSEAIVIPTDAWAKKIGRRHSYEYHPLLNFKTWLRFPVGVTYGAALVGTGVAVGLGGCAAFSRSSGGGDGCEASLRLGGYIMGLSKDAVNATLQPDLRHWEKFPSAFVLFRKKQVAENQAIVGPQSICFPLGQKLSPIVVQK